MLFEMKQISSLEKVRITDSFVYDEIDKKTVLAGERFSYQIAMKCDTCVYSEVTVESTLSPYITLYQVRDAYMDVPITVKPEDPQNYITLEPGFMPDVLIPLADQNHRITVKRQGTTLWVKVDIPRDTKPGMYTIKVNLSPKKKPDSINTLFAAEKVMTIEVLPVMIPEQKLIYTRWIYVDCIAVQHNAKIYSEEHWTLIDKYIAAAADIGINMLLVPTHTPPLDTAIGAIRPCVQLVDIEKKGDKYEFNFEKFERFVNICKKNGIQYFEMPHMFSQWGAMCAANIMVTENGKTDYMFGWHVAADSEEYTSFLKQYISAICAKLAQEGISDYTYFHISDEPGLETMETYKKASDILRPLIGNIKTIDALSNYEFYEKGLLECPVTIVSHIHEFLEHEIEDQWAYYCCIPETIFTNAFMSMPSCRTRILGFLLYKYNIKGFLHWGFNFYNSRESCYPINPYMTTSADGIYPSGDSFIVYPGKDSVYPSIRGEVTYQGIQDMDICFALEKYIGREAVVTMIDKAAGRALRFDDYPNDNAFLENLRAEMIEKIRMLA